MNRTKQAELRPEQTDPLAYELASLQRFADYLVADSLKLSPDHPADQQRILMNVYRLEETKRQLEDLARRAEIKARPIPPTTTKRHLTLVWSQK